LEFTHDNRLEFWAHTEKMFLDLFDEVSAIIPAEHLVDIKNFVDHNEHGIALKDFELMIQEEKHTLSPRAIQIITLLKDHMNLKTDQRN
jgi:hypothetical protein